MPSVETKHYLLLKSSLIDDEKRFVKPIYLLTMCHKTHHQMCNLDDCNILPTFILRGFIYDLDLEEIIGTVLEPWVQKFTWNISNIS